MAKYTPERREELFALMRARQAERRELAATPASPAQVSPRRLPSEATVRRRERLKAAGVPAHLEMYRVKEVAQMLGVSSQSVLNYFGERGVVIADRKPGKKLKRTLLISRQVLEQWLAEHQAQAS